MPRRRVGARGLLLGLLCLIARRLPLLRRTRLPRRADSEEVRFPSDEAARHAVVDLLGDLSLLAAPGGRGIPAGHVVAYRPTHALQAAFVVAMQRAAGRA